MIRRLYLAKFTGDGSAANPYKANLGNLLNYVTIGQPGTMTTNWIFTIQYVPDGTAKTFTTNVYSVADFVSDGQGGWSGLETSAIPALEKTAWVTRLLGLGMITALINSLTANVQTYRDLALFLLGQFFGQASISEQDLCKNYQIGS